MLSRIAESLYWMSRNLERADDTARILDINVRYMLEADEGATEAMQWTPLLTIVEADERYLARHPDGQVTVQRVIRFLTQDKDNPGSLYNSLRIARENARVVRDRISQEMWEAINQFWLTTDSHLKTKLQPWRAADLYAYVHREVALFFGLTQSTMMRGEAYGFTALGSLQERADMTARILDVRYHLLLPDLTLVGSPLDYYQWGALLKSLSGFEAYRRKYQSGIRPIDVVEFVLLDPDFPRSLRCCMDGMERALGRIGQVPGGDVPAHMAALRAHLTDVSSRGILEQGLHEYLERFLDLLAALTTALQADYFQAHMAAAEDSPDLPATRPGQAAGGAA
ncbi:alpha-E domain-containing protein [uncultured Thiohalocapsa sp.]|uniref:alpha-E domain-containing protein n=1 Tax=uncultured Thiohalocapsa sp. TaxID=768990 RepID=UPI0025F20B68|nr:alpha-E domain-containing protein [uncultured Thiohalocapsa sp.]